MIRHLAFAALLCLSVSATASAAESGDAAQPGQLGTTDTTGTADTTATTDAAPATTAGPAIYNGFTVDEAATLMQEAGYRSRILVDSNGFPYIESGASGLVFEVNFYGCDGGEPERCLQLQFRASFGTDDAQKEKALQYNIDKVFGRAYNLDQSTYLEHPMHTNGGVTGDYLVNNLYLWDNVLGEFAAYIGW